MEVDRGNDHHRDALPKECRFFVQVEADNGGEDE